MSTRAATTESLSTSCPRFCLTLSLCARSHLSSSLVWCTSWLVCLLLVLVGNWYYPVSLLNCYRCVLLNYSIMVFCTLEMPVSIIGKTHSELHWELKVQCYWTGFKATAGAFFIFMFTVTLVAYTATAMTMAISADQTVVAVANIFMTISFVFMMVSIPSQTPQQRHQCSTQVSWQV